MPSRAGCARRASRCRGSWGLPPSRANSRDGIQRALCLFFALKDCAVGVGEADIADVHAHCDAIKAGIRDSEQFVVKDAGHLIQLEKPDEVMKRLEDFAARCERSRR